MDLQRRRLECLFKIGILQKKLYSIGNPIGKGEFYIFSKNKKIIKKNDKGELVYKGKNVYCGYIENYRGFKTLDKIRLLFTGDLAYRDNSNNIIISGRKGRF